MKRLPIILVLLALACETPKDTPVSAGAGVRIDNVGPEIEVDTRRAPLIDDCPTGQAVGGGSSGDDWACQTLSSLDDRLEAIERLLSVQTGTTSPDLPGRLDTLDALLAGEPGPTETPAVYVPSSACALYPDSSSVLVMERADGRVFLRGTRIGSGTVFCPIYPGGDRYDWNVIKLMIDDPDGPGEDASISVSLKPVDKNSGAAAAGILGSGRTTNSNQSPDPRLLTVNIDDLRLDFENTYYYFQVELNRTRNDLSPSFTGVLWARE